MKIDFNKNWKVKVLNSKDDYKNISVGKLQICQKYVMEKAKATHNSIHERESL